MGLILTYFWLAAHVSAALIAPISLQDVVRGLVLFSVASFVLLPFSAYGAFALQFTFPAMAENRLSAVIRLWFTASVVTGAVFLLLYAIGHYSLAGPGPNPEAGFLLAGLIVSTMVSFGVWGAFAAILPGDFATKGALVTGFLLFVAVSALGYLLASGM